jgi:hypothetical protein
MKLKGRVENVTTTSGLKYVVVMLIGWGDSYFGLEK